MITPLILSSLAQTNGLITVVVQLGKPRPGQLYRIRHIVFSNRSGESVTFRPVLQLQHADEYVISGQAVGDQAGTSQLVDFIVGEGEQFSCYAVGTTLKGQVYVRASGELIQADDPAGQ